MEFSDFNRVPVQLTHGCLVASIQTDLDERILQQLQKDLLQQIQKVRPAGVILDPSGLAVIDAHEFAALRRTMAMAEVMGAHTVITGLQPGVVSSLVDLEVDCSGLQTTLVLEDAFDRIHSRRAMKPSAVHHHAH